MKQYIVLSADIVASTSLKANDRDALEKSIRTFFNDLQAIVPSYSRLIKGDTIEIVVGNPQEGLLVAMALKALVKSHHISLKDYTTNKKRVKHFIENGVRIAIGYGTLERYNPQKGIIDGDAIYRAGRTINGLKTYNKERIVVKNTLFFDSSFKALNAPLKPILELLDVLFSKATQKQATVVYHKLFGKTENEIATLLQVDQSVVNRHSTSVGWNAMETAITYFRASMKEN